VEQFCFAFAFIGAIDVCGFIAYLSLAIKIDKYFRSLQRLGDRKSWEVHLRIGSIFFLTDKKI